LLWRLPIFKRSSSNSERQNKPKIPDGAKISKEDAGRRQIFQVYPQVIRRNSHFGGFRPKPTMSFSSIVALQGLIGYLQTKNYYEFKARNKYY